MISNDILYKIFGLSGFFNPDLCQYQIKSAFFTSRNEDFQSLGKMERFGSFQTQHKRVHDHQRARRVIIMTAVTACNIRLIVDTLAAYCIAHGLGLSC